MTDTATSFPTDHAAPAEVLNPPMPEPIGPTHEGRRRSAAEEARTLVAQTNVATLATLSEDGHPWGSLVSYATLADGSPVLCVSLLAEHGRNLRADQRASLVVAEPARGGDPLNSGRVTLAGVAQRPTGTLEATARDAYVQAHPPARLYAGFGDFSLWVLRVDRVRWVGGYGRMDSADAASYRAAEPDPVQGQTAYAIAHLNADHADALLLMARAFGGHPDALSATCTGADRYGIELRVVTPRGETRARIGFAEPIVEPDGLRGATVELTRRSRAALA
ncbi:HugZ family protein [Paraconexibacter algicola]|uniref:Pyridoxamine 5'-phosphate oxidase n=1 Tax=Paraconexibacter algicola TaxID=2133960 RepID=A0A2T4UH22_9ACTN|nr:DUF2470 domain-containing protein [Paraconexibacter algicola]PTL58517.1 pyridoxamine 5'-phosphate oxidase [Paraconexibacter algicola]